MLTAFRVTYDNGNVESYNMAKGITLNEAHNYYVGQRFEITETTFRTAVKVEQIISCTHCGKLHYYDFVPFWPKCSCGHCFPVN